MSPRVTIGIPVYNEAPFLEQTIRSALAQTEPCAILISDNGSTDGSERVALGFAGHPNVTIDFQNRNIGAFANFFFLLRECRTPFFCLLGGHDVLHPEFIATALEHFEMDQGVRPPLSLVYPRTELIDRQGHPITTERPYVGCTPKTDDVDTCALDDVEGPLKVARNEHNAHAFNGLFRTEVLRASTFYRVAGGDHLMVYQAALQGRVHRLDELATRFRVVREETFEEALERWERTFGLAFDRTQPHRKMCDAYTMITRDARMDEARRFRILRGLFPILRERFGYEESEGEFR